MKKCCVVPLLLLGMACANKGSTTSDGDPLVEQNGVLSPTDPNNPNNPNNVASTEPIPVPVCTLNAPADINVVVTSKKGPNGFASPIPVDDGLYSMGIDDRTPSDFVPTPDPTYVAYLKAIKPGWLRFPAGVNGQRYRWKTSGDGGYPNMTPVFIDRFVALCRAVGAQPFMAINLETAPIAEAAAIVDYCNVQKKYGITWWQIGNEPNLPGEWDKETGESPTVYPQRFLQWRQAMLAVDPTLKFVGVESYTGEGIRGTSSEIDWFAPFMSAVGDKVDAVAWHYYPLYSGTATRNVGKSSSATVSNLLQEHADDWPPAGMDYADIIMPYMRSKMATVAPKAKVWIDEYAEDSGTQLNAEGLGDTMAGALWAADTMGRYADQGVGAIFHFIFKAHQPNSGMYFGYTLLDGNNVPRPEYYAFWMMANHFGDQMVATTTDQKAKVASHAAIRQADGSLRVMLVNKSTTAQKVHLKLADFAPVRASQYVVSATSMAAKTATINGATLSMANIGQGDQAVASAKAEACTDNTFTVPATSVTLLIFTTK